MGHWWEGIRIINDIDYYYAIIIINIIVPCLSFGCSIHVFLLFLFTECTYMTKT